MNKRRVHELMRAHFPSSAPAQQAWTNIADVQGRLLAEQAYVTVAQPFVDRGVEEVLVQVHRKVGGRMPLAQLMAYVAEHLAQGHIRIADRAFSVLCVVAANGVATSWQSEAVTTQAITAKPVTKTR